MTTSSTNDSCEKEVHTLVFSRLLKGVMGSGMVQAFGAGLTLLGSIVLARFLGTEEFGIFSYCMSWITLLAIVARFGADQYLVRQVSHYQAMEKWPLMRGIFAWAHRFCLVTSILVILPAAAVAWFVTESGGVGQTAFFASLLLIPLMTLTIAWQSFLRGLHHILWGRVGEMVVAPFLSIVLATAVWWWVRPGMTAMMAIGVTITAWGLALLVVGGVLKRHTPAILRGAKPQNDYRNWTMQMLPLMLVMLLATINTRADMLMLGAIHGTAKAGLYFAASMTALLIVFPLMAFNNALAPNFSRLYAHNQRDQLQRIVVHSARVVLCCAIIPAIGLMLAGKWVLSLYGNDFPAAAIPLAILAGAQLVNAAAGSVGVLLAMTGHGREMLMAMLAAAVVNVTLNAILIPQYQMIGAAISTSAGTVVWNVIMIIVIRQKLKLSCTAFGREPTQMEPDS